MNVRRRFLIQARMPVTKNAGRKATFWKGREEELRDALISALDMLAGKRVPTVAKKHSTIGD